MAVLSVICLWKKGDSIISDLASTKDKLSFGHEWIYFTQTKTFPLYIIPKFIIHKKPLGAIGVNTIKPFSQIMLVVIPPRKSESPEVVGRLSDVTAHVNLQPFTVLHQSRRWSTGIKCETTQIWCASRYIILCMYYLHSMYSSHRSLLCLASRGFRTPPEPEAEAGHNLKPSCPLNTNQAVWLIGMRSIACSVSQWRVRRSGLSLWVHNSIHDSLLN